MAKTKQRSDRSPSPMELYYAGKISAEEYVTRISRSPIADQNRQASEKRVKRILKSVAL